MLHSVVRSVPWACLGPACTPHWAGSGPRHREHSDSVRRFTAGLGKRAQEPPRGAVWECRAAGDAQLLRRQTRPLGRAPFLALGAGLLNSGWLGWGCCRACERVNRGQVITASLLDACSSSCFFVPKAEAPACLPTQAALVLEPVGPQGRAVHPASGDPAPSHFVHTSPLSYPLVAAVLHAVAASASAPAHPRAVHVTLVFHEASPVLFSTLTPEPRSISSLTWVPPFTDCRCLEGQVDVCSAGPPRPPSRPPAWHSDAHTLTCR